MIVFDLASTHVRRRCQVALPCAAGPRCSIGAYPLREKPASFDPGLSTPHLKAIEGENQPTGAIDVPSSDSRPNDPSSVTSRTGGFRGPVRSHAARVIGSFDHPVLPEPPVRF
jgi:hypothetical protein